MAIMFGRFDVQSEISKSETALIYKVLDTKTNQIAALKIQSLAPLGPRADAFVDTLIAEGEAARELAGQNIVALYGAGEIDGQFCAAMEYIQGNSLANMLARKEGFSIWDLLDITRQVSAGLTLAASKHLIHCSLEPAKIMVQWDGTVKILGYGISNMSLIEAESGKNLGRLMPYCSPEQIRGEAIDLRSNLFTLAAILYEMVAGRKAFDSTDPVTLVNQIENEMPPNPTSVNPRIQAGVSAVIMKALAKDPAERYQGAREMLEELEKCKDQGKKTVAAETPRITPPPVTGVNPAAGSAAAIRSVSPGFSSSSSAAAPAIAPLNPVATSVTTVAAPDSKPGPKSPGQFQFNVNAPEYQAARVAVLSAPAPAPPLDLRETSDHRKGSLTAPSVAVDPIMARLEPKSSKLFSDLAEMPPLKPENEAGAESTTPPSVAQILPGRFPAKAPSSNSDEKSEEKPGEKSGEKSQEKSEEKSAGPPPQVAAEPLRQLVIQQIATVPPRLILYSICGAAGLIGVMLVALFLHSRSEDRNAGNNPSPITNDAFSTPSPAAPSAKKPVTAIQEALPNLQVRPVKKAVANKSPRPTVAAPAPVAIPGEAFIDSNPQGAQFHVDEKGDSSWLTPFILAGLSPGKHLIAISKPGYSSEIRSLEITPGNRSSLSLRLFPLNALMVVASTPAGAEIILDGKPTKQLTPAQFAVEKGSHTVLLRKSGYLDETVTADLSPAQNFQFSPQLRPLGNTEDMRTVGKFSKLFGRGGDSTAGMGSVSVHTQPKGAQVAINQRILDKLSPVDVMLGPGNYIVDITLTGFKPVRQIVNVDKGGKTAIDQVLDRQ